ncbi:MAG: AmmeMemoRadiSam system protein B [Candidatus Aenigmatarchaeota archaeon]
MGIREPCVAGAFYPYDSNELKKIIEKFIEKSEKKDILGIVSPHAGYIYCGKTAGKVYSLIKEFDTAIILGPNHYGMGAGIATSSGKWKTPFGIVDIDEEFSKELIKDSIIMEDFRAHLREHSIEVQLPWLQYLFQNFKFTPITINPIYFDIKTCKEIGENIAQVAKKLKRKVLIISSSDFTHYGSNYGYKPFSGTVSQVLKKIKETDTEAINYITKIMPERLIEYCSGKTICGYGGIAAMLWAVKQLGANNGELIDYSTSFEVSKDISAIVGYAGIAIY